MKECMNKLLSLIVLLLSIFSSAEFALVGANNITESKQVNLKSRITSFMKKHPIATGAGIIGGIAVSVCLFKICSSNAQKVVFKILYGHGIREKSGSQQREIEDQLNIKTSKINNLQITTFCVCDGTGGPGVSKYIAQNVHDKLKNAFKSKNDTEIGQFIKDACKKLDFEIRDKLLNGSIADGQNVMIPEENGSFTNFSPTKPRTQGDIVSGSTATIGIIVQKPDGAVDFWSCNVGDSKNILTQSNNGQEEIIFNSKEHSLTDPIEGQRMENFKNPYDSSINYVYNIKEKRRSNLTTSRLFGSWRHKSNNDNNYEQSAVIAVPDVQKIALNPQSTLIVTTDGLLHILKEEEVVSFVHTHINQTALLKETEKIRTIAPKESNALNQCVQQLITYAHEKEGTGYHDDKGVIVAKLLP